MARAAAGEGEDRGGRKAVDAVLDEHPTLLRLLQQIKIVGLVFEMHISFDDETHHNVEETDIEDEVVHDEEEFPAKGLFVLNQGCDPSRPGL